ncbi:hypothetical protein PsorP6_014916 [Peronosclerospora sorghi]|uniref:Uncharacterized protein n=1 Tax=Peronosclerospora sorghi TaxID=230839 RepID=A0ACC0VS35_9STRA|nr:hypothetical protein PsorP6_014916 [Peronosclerospora sorghi]
MASQLEAKQYFALISIASTMGSQDANDGRRLQILVQTKSSEWSALSLYSIYRSLLQYITLGMQYIETCPNFNSFSPENTRESRVQMKPLFMC